MGKRKKEIGREVGKRRIRKRNKREKGEITQLKARKSLINSL